MLICGVLIQETTVTRIDLARRLEEMGVAFTPSKLSSLATGGMLKAAEATGDFPCSLEKLNQLQAALEEMLGRRAA